MKTKMLNIVSMLLLLNILVACGGESASSNKTEQQNSTVKISVEQPSAEKVYFLKIGNVDLEIASMKMDVYTTDDATDSDPSDNTLFRTKALTKSDSAWEGTLTALEKESIYIFVASAKNANDQVIFTGATTKKVETGVNNAVDIKLAQSSDLYDDNSDVVPTANALSASKDANGNITFSFSINNPNEESLTWSLFKEDGSTLSTEFSVNTGTSNNASEFIQVTYTKDTNDNNTDYVLELKSKEGKTSYAFNIDFEGETVSVTVNTPPIIESLNVVVEGDTLNITPVLDKEPNGIIYAWSFEYSDAEVITNPTEKTVTITGYNENSYLDLRLDVSQNGASSYRIYTIRGHANQNVQLIDTSKQEVLDILGVSKGEADALLALYQSTNMAIQNFETWNTLTPVDNWEWVTVENGVITGLDLFDEGLTGSIPPELGNLTSLRYLSLYSNQLTGSIPPELGNLTSLERLYLDGNQLTGSMPPELGNLTSLKYLSLSRNQLTGSIPPELGSLTSLERLYLYGNQLTGSLPLSIGQLGNLTSLRINDNLLTGVISDQDFMTFLNALSTFSFDDTELFIEGVTSD